jgi:hypothetical protein
MTRPSGNAATLDTTVWGVQESVSTLPNQHRPHFEGKTRRVAECAAHRHHVRDGMNEQQAARQHVRQRVRRQIGEDARHRSRADQVL